MSEPAMSEPEPTTGQVGQATVWLVLDEPGGDRIALPDGPDRPVTIGRDPACEAQVPFDLESYCTKNMLSGDG